MPSLTTNRTVIRDAQLDDAGAVTAYRSLPSVARFQRWNPTVEEFHASIERQNSRPPFTANEWHLFVIAVPSAADPIGDVGVFPLRAGDVALGITIAPQFQRKGFAAEALFAVCRYLFANGVARRLIVHVDAANEASLALFRGLGFGEEMLDGDEVTMCLREARLPLGHPSTGSG